MDKSKAEAALALQAAGIRRKSFSREEFCARQGISPGLYRKLQAQGLGPRETRLLNRIIISIDDEAAWLRERASTAAT